MQLHNHIFSLMKKIILFTIIFLFISSCSNGALDLDVIKFAKTINVKKINEIRKHNLKTSNSEEEYHKKAAQDFGKYVGDPVYGGVSKAVIEIFQFLYYSADDLTRRVVPGGKKKGKYQPYLFKKENGGIKDSIQDIKNVAEGAKKDKKNLDYSMNYKAEKTALKSMALLLPIFLFLLL